MRRILVTMTLCAAMANLGGCVLAIGNGDSDDSSWTSSHVDSSLARAVRANYDADPALREADLKIWADHGRVYLEGSVHSAETLAKAVQVALDTAEVKSVHCRIVVIR